eukprot:m.101667 g.101667  ORF g.101667 m.101667 type:complete len:74 (-) comp8797_c2_seq1:1431-1652(-)
MFDAATQRIYLNFMNVSTMFQHLCKEESAALCDIESKYVPTSTFMNSPAFLSAAAGFVLALAKYVCSGMALPS